MLSYTTADLFRCRLWTIVFVLLSASLINAAPAPSARDAIQRSSPGNNILQSAGSWSRFIFSKYVLPLLVNWGSVVFLYISALREFRAAFISHVPSIIRLMLNVFMVRFLPLYLNPGFLEYVARALLDSIKYLMPPPQSTPAPKPLAFNCISRLLEFRRSVIRKVPSIIRLSINTIAHLFLPFYLNPGFLDYAGVTCVDCYQELPAPQATPPPAQPVDSHRPISASSTAPSSIPSPVKHPNVDGGMSAWFIFAIIAGSALLAATSFIILKRCCYQSGKPQEAS